MSFQGAELGSKVSKDEYRGREDELRADLLNAQFDLRSSDFSLLILIVGDDREGCEDIIDLLNEWMDARELGTEVFIDPRSEEREHPPAWRYWRALPRYGRTRIFLGAWPREVLVGQILEGGGEAEWVQAIEHIRRLEQTLAAENTLLVKLWLHVPKKELKKRIRKAENHKHGRRLVEDDRRLYEHYDEVVALGERLVQETDEEHAPWTVVESTDEEYRNLRIMETVRAALLERLGRTAPPAEPRVASAEAELGSKTVLDTADLSASLGRDQYRERLERLQRKLSDRSIEAREKGVASVLVFEGWDAAGKGGAIRRLTGAMSARDYAVAPIAAPTDEELARHYLWRFWRRVPRDGRMTIFDRSWYGRVLVERVEGFATREQWRRAYSEIVEFERGLVEHGMLVQKFWLHIDREEQLRRFQERETTTYKKYKITEDDYRNRDKWEEYVVAVNEMVARTHTSAAPWTVVPANDKRFARIQVLESVCSGLESLLG